MMIKFVLVLFLFCSVSQVFSSDLFENDSFQTRTTEETGSISPKWPSPPNFPVQKEGLLLFPEVLELGDLSLDQVAQILELSFNPLKNGRKRKIDLDLESLMVFIVDNFYHGNAQDMTEQELKRRRGLGYLFPKYNRFVLNKFQADQRFGAYFSFQGCLKLFAKCLRKLEAGNLDKSKMSEAVFNLEDFFDYLVNELTLPSYSSHPLIRQMHHLGYYSILSAVPHSSIVKVGSHRFYQILLDRFKPWIGTEDFFKIFNDLRRLLLNSSYALTRSIAKSLDQNSPLEAFCFEPFMARTYNKITTKLFSRVKSDRPDAREKVYAIWYLQMLPILRSLRLVDPIERIESYLRVYKSVAQPQILGSQKESKMLRIFDHLLADSDFIVKSQSNPILAEQVMDLLTETFEWNRAEVLFSAARRGLLNLTEAFLTFDWLDEDLAMNLIAKTIQYITNIESVEIFALLVGHCRSIRPERLQRFADSIDLSSILALTDLSDSESAFDYNRVALAKSILSHATTLLNLIPHRRPIVAQYENETLALSCPAHFIDLLFPSLVKAIDDPAPEYNLYPNMMLVNLAQLILLRVFGIPFAATRVIDDSRETFDWSELIGFLNLSIEIHAQRHGITAPLVKFYDPIAEELTKQGLGPEEYAQKYRDAVFFLGEDDYCMILECLEDEDQETNSDEEFHTEADEAFDSAD